MSLIGRRSSSRVSTMVERTHNRLLTPFTFGQHINTAIETPFPVNYGTVRSHSYTSAGVYQNWLGLEPVKDAPVYGPLDTWVDHHYNRGRRIILDLSGTPDWAVAAPAAGATSEGGVAYGGKSNMPPDNNADWVSIIQRTALRYKGKIYAYEGWNEPNLDRYWNGAAATPARLAELQRLLYQTVKAADPNALVLSPSFTSVFSGIAGSPVVATGFRQFLAASDNASGTGAQWFDHCAYHFYCNDNSARLSGLQRMYAGVLQELATANRSNARIFATETGVLSPALSTYSLADRKKLLRMHMITLLAMGAECILWFSFEATVFGFGTNDAERREMAAVWEELYSACVGKVLNWGRFSVEDQFIYTATISVNGQILTETFRGLQ